MSLAGSPLLPDHTRITLLGRFRPGAKLLGVFVFGAAVTAVSGWSAALMFLGIGLALIAVSGIRIRTCVQLLGRFAPVGAMLFGFQLWQHGWEHAVEIVAGLLALICAASAFTASTAIGEMLDTITWSLRPLQRFGASPERIALAFSLAIRAIPRADAIARETLQAARARGLKRHPRAFAIPFAVRMVAYARDTGAALHARGLGDD